MSLYLIIVLSQATSPPTATYSGNFWTVDPAILGRTHDDVKKTTTKIIITLAGETWAPDVATDTTKRTALVQAVVDSNKGPTSLGFEKAIEYQRDSVINWAANVARDSATQVTLTVPPLPSYDLPPERFEYIQAGPVPALCTNTPFGLHVNNTYGTKAVVIFAITALFSGNHTHTHSTSTVGDGWVGLV